MEIISAKYVLTMNNSDDPIEDGAMAVELGKIQEVGQRDDLKKKYPGSVEIENSDYLMMPGLINSHCNLDLKGYQKRNRPLLSEEPETNDYIDWLTDTINYRKNVSTTEIMSSVQDSAQEAIDSGTTCIGGATIFEGTFRLLDEMGIRAIVFNEIFSGKSDVSQDLFENALAIVEKYFDPTKDRKINAGILASAPYLLSKNLLRILAQHAQNDEIPIAIRASESFSEMEFFFDSKGPIGEKLFPSIGWGEELPPAHQKTPINYLHEIGFLNASPSIVGGLHLSDRCIKTLARDMCRIIYCPTYNTYFGHGTLPIEKLQKHGIPISIGTGAPIRSQAFSMWNEMREALKLTAGSPSPREILQMSTISGARALGLENQTGTLAKGKMADYIIVDLPPGHEIDKNYIYGALIRNTHHFNVRKTVVGGEVLKSI